MREYKKVHVGGGKCRKEFCKICTVKEACDMISFRGNMKFLKVVLDAVGEYAIHDVPIDVDSSGVRVKVLDGAHVCGIDAHISKDVFAQVSGEGSISFPVDNYKKTLKQFLASGNVEVKADENYISFSKKNINHNVPITRHNEAQKVPSEISGLEEVTVNSDRLYEAINSVKGQGDVIRVDMSKDGVMLNCYDEAMGASSPYSTASLWGEDIIESGDFEGTMSSAFAREYLVIHLPVIKASSSTKIGVGNNMPLVLEPNIKNMAVKFMIAPRVHSEESE